MDAEISSTQKRVSIACLNCRKRKRKCDGIQPACTSCRSQNKQCHYDTLQTGGRKRKWTHDYVSSLEEQLIALKAYSRDLENRLECSSKVNLDSSRNEFHLEEEVERSLYNQLDAGPILDVALDHDHRSTSAIDDISSLMWKMSICETGDTSFIGPSGNFCFSTSSPLLSKNANNLRVTSDVHRDTTSLFASYSQDKIMRLELMGLFAEFINPFHQFVGPQSLFLVPFDPHDNVSTFLQSAILAAGSRLSSRHDAENIGDCFASNAESLALKCCRDYPSLKVVQALTIMCWRELSLENENMAWMYNSMAGSLCIHMGLHVGALEYLNSEPQSKTSSMVDHEPRVRTFWQFFLVDRYSYQLLLSGMADFPSRMATSILGRQCIIPWKRVKTLSFESILDASSSLDEVVFDHQCKLWLLHDQFMDQIYSFEFPTLSFTERNKLLMDARERVVTFHQNIDDRLRFDKVVTSGYIACFQMSYQMSLLLIHRPYLREPPDSGSYGLALRSMTAAASIMTNLIRAYRKLDSFNRAPFYIVHHILTAAIMHLLSATSSQQTLRQQSITRFRVCVEALEELQSTWPRAKKSIGLLQELAKRWSVVFALPMRFSNVSHITDPSNSIYEAHRGQPQQEELLMNHELATQINDSFQSTNNDSSIAYSGLEDTNLVAAVNYNDLWMEPTPFNNFAIPDDPFGDVGLDWLFAPPQP